MKCKFIVFFIGLFVLSGLVNAEKLALIKITPEKRLEAAQMNIQMYHDFKVVLLVKLDNKLEQTIQTKGWQYEILDQNLASDEYFLVYKVGLGKSSYPGKFLFESNRSTLVRMSEPEALQAKAQGFEMRLLQAYSLQIEEPLEEFFIPRHDSLVQQMVQAVSLDSLLTTLRRLQNYGTRYTYSRKCDTAAWYLRDRLVAYSLPTVYDIYLAGTQRDTSYNVIATITGQVQPESIVIICGHFDSYSNTPYTSAPGADDNGTGTAVVIEAARILSRYRFRWTIKFVAFSGEEQWMLGSYHWVDSVAVPQQLKIGGAYNFDMIAYTAYDSTRMYVNRNTASTPLAVLAESANVQYDIGLNLINYLDEDCAGDNTPFWEHGYKAVFALEDTEWGIWNGSNPHYHTTHDTIGILRLGQVLRGAKLGVACVAAMAGPIGLNTINENTNLSKEQLKQFPTIMHGVINIPGNKSVDLYNITGKKVYTLKSGNNNVRHLAPGIYFIRQDQNKHTTKIILQH
jgi:hypothetical protein